MCFSDQTLAEHVAEGVDAGEACQGSCPNLWRGGIQIAPLSCHACPKGAACPGGAAGEAFIYPELRRWIDDILEIISPRVNSISCSLFCKSFLK
jgi:hypothetical protein